MILRGVLPVSTTIQTAIGVGALVAGPVAGRLIADVDTSNISGWIGAVAVSAAGAVVLVSAAWDKRAAAKARSDLEIRKDELEMQRLQHEADVVHRKGELAIAREEAAERLRL